MFTDTRRAVRHFWSRSHGSATLSASLVFALGTGGICLMIALAYALWVQRAPLPHPSELVEVELFSPADAGMFGNAPSLMQLKEWQRRDLGGLRLAGFQANSESAVAAGEFRDVVPAIPVSNGMFAMLGVRPAFGRALQPSDSDQGAPPVAVLSFGLADRMWGQPQNALGARLQLNGAWFQVVGVMPPRFHVPLSLQNGEARSELWFPIPAERAYTSLAPDARMGLEVIGRLPSGDSVATAEGRLAPLPGTLHARIHDLLTIQSRDVQSGVLVAAAAALALYLLVGINLAVFLTVHGLRRQRDTALRLALGAHPWSIHRQFLTDALVLTLPSGAAGITLCALLLPEAAPHWAPVLASGIAVALHPAVIGITAVAIGMIAMLAAVIGIFATRASARRQTLFSAGTAGSLSPHRQTLLRSVLILELAGTAVLLVAAAVFTRSLVRMSGRSRGYAPQGLVLAGRFLLPPRYPSPSAQLDFDRRAQLALTRIPEVASVGIASGAPLFGGTAGVVQSESGSPHHMDAWSVGGSYFLALGAHLVRGTLPDGFKDSASVVLDQAAATLLFGNQNPIGQPLRWGTAPQHQGTVSAVIGNITDIAGFSVGSVRAITHPHVFVPITAQPSGVFRVAVRYRGPASDGVAAVRAALLGLDSTAPVKVESASSMIASDLAQARLLASLLAALALLSSCIAGLGIFAAVGFATEMRVHEIAIRLAMGAEPHAVWRLFLKRTAMDCALAIATSTVLAYWLVRAVQGLLFETANPGLVPMLGSSLLLFLAALSAAALPACRASRLDPADILRGPA